MNQTHHQKIVQNKALVTRQDQIKKATILQQEMVVKKRALKEEGFYELAAMFENFDIALYSYRSYLQVT